MSLSPTRHFRSEVRDAVATLTLDRPDVLNALTFEVYTELRDTFRALAGTAEVRAVVLTGAGRGFCSGGDVRKIIGELFARDAAGLLAFTELTCDLVRAMRACPQPIVAAVNGIAAGAGAMLALASDVRLAAPEARFAFLFVKVGLSGADMGATWLLPRVVGLGRATEWLMTGDPVDAATAERAGLVNRIVPADRLLAEAHALAGRLARGPAAALAVTKRALDDSGSGDAEAALRREAALQARCMVDPDYREAYEAFVAKRPPRFRGAPT